MENKYYVPIIEEFHVGFEYEVFVNKNFEYWDHTKGTWVKNEFYGGGADQDGGNTEIEALRYLLEDNKSDVMVRVKCLDKEDIESLGWAYIPGWEAMNYRYFKLGSFVIKIDTEYKYLFILHGSGDVYEDYVTVFYGIIKNKSRLSLIMEMCLIKLDVA